MSGFYNQNTTKALELKRKHPISAGPEELIWFKVLWNWKKIKKQVLGKGRDQLKGPNSLLNNTLCLLAINDLKLQKGWNQLHVFPSN